MRIKRIILLLCLVFLTTACSINYELEFKNKKISENTTIYLDSTQYDTYSTYYIQALEEDYNSGVEDDWTKKVPGTSYYNNKHIQEKNALNYSYVYNVKNYKKSYLALVGIEYFNFLENEDSYVISTGSNIKEYSDLGNIDEIKVHIKSNHTLIDTNADEVDGYNYYWNLSKDTSKYIYLEVSKNKYIFNYEGEFIKTIIIVLIIALFILLIVLYLYKRAKRLGSI